MLMLFILFFSVVTSVSVIMDTGNGSKAVFTDAVGKPVSKPAAAAHLASPINLLNPDRYEFYTFDDSGDLVKRLMTLEEIQQIIANGDGDGIPSNSAVVDYSPEKKVDDVVNNVQNVLKEEIEKNSDRPVMDDLSSSWTMVLPAVFGNSGEEVVPDGNLIVATPETIMVEPTSEVLTTSKQEVTANGLLVDSKTGSEESVRKTTLSPETTTPFEKLSTFIPVFASVSTDASSPTIALDNQNKTTQMLPISTTEVEKQTTTEFVDLPALKENEEFVSPVAETTFQPTTSNPSSETTIKSITTTQKQQEAASTTITATETTIKEDEAATTPNNPQQLSVESTKIPMPAEEFPSSTYSFLTTFFGMNTIQNTTNPQIADTTTTTEAQSTEGPSTINALDIEKLAVTELLDQLLQSSTNVYQEATVESKTESEAATSQPEVTTKMEQSVISSIEQLLSQVITHVEEPDNSTQEQGEKVHEFMVNMGEKNMTEVQEQTATVMSSLMGNLDVDLIKQQNEEITYRNVFKNATVATEEPPILDESVDSFISQVVLEEVSNATTIVDDLPASTTQKNEDMLPKVEDEIELDATSTTTENEGVSTSKEVFSTTEAAFQTTTTASEFSTTEKIEIKTEDSGLTTTDSSTTLDDGLLTTTTSDFTTTKAETVQSNVKWAPVSTIAPSTSTPIEKHPSIITNPTTPLSPSVDLSSQISAGFGLEDTTSQLDTDIYQFVQLCNELAFSFWKSTTGGLNPSRSLVVSPFAATSLLAMVFLGARGATSGEMNEILKLDDMVTFNPHLIFRNVTESIEVSKRAGVAASAIVRELYSDKNKGKLLSFYKERARQFYDGHVEEANFKEIGDVIRRRTNLLVKRSTWGKIHEFIKENSVTVRPPLAGVSVNIFQTDCSAASTANRDGEIYFQVSPTIRQRRLVPIPAAVWRSGFLAGYEPGLDATAVAIGAKDQVISTIFVMPGQQGIAAPGDGLARLEQHLVESAIKEGSWIRLLNSLVPRIGLEVQIPRFSHKSFVNATMALQRMGLKDLFDHKKADLRGLNGVSHELYLSDIVQINNFATCGENRIDESHHIETYPSINNSRKLKDEKEAQRAFDEKLFDAEYLSMPLPLRPRQARVPDVPKLRFDRPFLYFVRHNPTGLIMHMGRFNPRLLP